MDPHCSAVECFPNWRAKKKKDYGGNSNPEEGSRTSTSRDPSWSPGTEPASPGVCSSVGPEIH